MNIVVFDVETKELAPRGDPTERELGAIGISVACAFDYLTGEYSAYMQDNLGALWWRLTQADLVVGFNIRRFDVPVLFWPLYEALGSGGEAPEIVDQFEETKALVLSKCYDIYEESKLGARAGKYDRGFRADDHLRAIWGHPSRQDRQRHGRPPPVQGGEDGRAHQLLPGRRPPGAPAVRAVLEPRGPEVHGRHGPGPAGAPGVPGPAPAAAPGPAGVHRASLADRLPIAGVRRHRPAPTPRARPQVEGLASDAI